MANSKVNLTTIPARKRGNILFPVLILWGAVLVVGFLFFWLNEGFGGSLKGYYLLPWCLFTGAIVLSPSAYYFYKGKFDPFHPLIFAAWSYIFPAFVIGGVIVSFQLVDPYFLAFIDDPEYQYPLSLIYVGLGFLGLIIGYSLPIGAYFAESISPRLPKWHWKAEQVWLPGLLLLAIGIAFNALGFIQGLLGFQRNVEFSTFDGTLFFLLVILTEGTVLLWLGIFSSKKRDGIFWIMVVVLLLFLPLRMAVIGSRSSLVIGLLPIALAYVYSGRTLKLKTGIICAAIGLVAVFIGVTYGTSFRNIKGSEARVSAGDYFGQVGATLEYLTNTGPFVIAGESAQALADRIDNLSSLAVVVARYERLEPYEASYGLENNILNDAYTSFIPRFIWNEKPPTSDARAYSDLYFNYSENSFAISPFGDLLRNFGPVGILIGMIFLGVYLRLIYSTLIDTPDPALWKKVAYFLLLTVVSYEGFFATIFPSIIRTVIVIGASLWLANIFVGRQERLQN